jgi:hypothetical protein
MGRRLLASLALIGILAAAPLSALELPQLRQPSWKELSVQQKQVLAPLSGDWDDMESVRRKKWIGIAARYPYMTPEEQARVQSQMREWAKLSPQERRLVRDKYKSLRQAPLEQQATIKQKWQEYKELPDDEKKRLQEEAKARAPVAKPKVVKNKQQPKVTPAAALAAPPKSILPPIAPVQQTPAPVFTATSIPPAPAPAAPSAPLP